MKRHCPNCRLQMNFLEWYKMDCYFQSPVFPRKGRGLWELDGIGSGYGQVAGTCEYGDEPSGSKNAGNFLTSCRTC